MYLYSNKMSVWLRYLMAKATTMYGWPMEENFISLPEHKQWKMFVLL